MDAGSLEDRGVASTLRALGDRKETGCLHVARGEQRAQVWLRVGVVYTAQAPEARARLGDRLVGAHKLDQSQLEQALAAQRAAGVRQRIGELLVERGMIDRETLRDYVQAQILDSVTAALSWRQGQWHFERGVETPEDVPLDMSIENLLMDATRRLQEWEVIRSELGSLDAIVDFAPRNAGAEVALTPDEWSLMTCIDGSATIAEIAEGAGYGQFETARIIYGLITAGIVQLVDDEPRQVDREALMAEFSALGTPEGSNREPVRRVEPGPQRSRPVHPEERRGLFDRFRKG